VTDKLVPDITDLPVTGIAANRVHTSYGQAINSRQNQKPSWRRGGLLGAPSLGLGKMSQPCTSAIDVIKPLILDLVFLIIHIHN